MVSAAAPPLHRVPSHLGAVPAAQVTRVSVFGLSLRVRVSAPANRVGLALLLRLGHAAAALALEVVPQAPDGAR
jgi:hypothetical protein